jgi:hypothetical protein
MTIEAKPAIYFIEPEADVGRYLMPCDRALLNEDFNLVYNASCNRHIPGPRDIVVTIKCASPAALLEVSSLAVDCISVCLVDGVVEWRNSYENPFYRNSKFQLYHENVFDYYLCVHEQSFNCLQSLGLPAIRIGAFQDPPLVVPPATEVERFLVTTAKQPFFDGFEKQALANELARICRFLRDNGKAFKLRIFDDTLMTSLEDFRDRNNTRESLDQAIAAVDAVFTTPSTVSLDVFALNKPVIHIDLRDGPLLFQSGWRLVPSYPIERVLESLGDKTRLAFQTTNLKPVTPEGTDFLNLHADAQKLATRRTLATINASPLNINLERPLKRLLHKYGVFAWLRVRLLSKVFGSKD